jgi:hypothetical protein
MRKYLTISLAVAYLTLSVGVVIGVHFCCNKVADVGFYLGCKNEKDCCGNTLKKGCCREEYKIVKLQENHISSTNVHPDFPKQISVSHSIFANNNSFQVSQLLSRYVIDHSPPIPKTDSYIIHCSFLI